MTVLGDFCVELSANKMNVVTLDVVGCMGVEQVVEFFPFRPCWPSLLKYSVISLGLSLKAGGSCLTGIRSSDCSLMSRSVSLGFPLLLHVVRGMTVITSLGRVTEIS